MSAVSASGRRGPWDNRNALWADALMRELVDAGVRQAVFSPGGRSMALGLALRRAEIEIAHVAVDERAGAFFALGLALASRRPTAMVITSGSAVANILPALAESEPRGVPLVVISGDRLGGASQGEPQCLDHLALSASLTRGSLHLPFSEPDAEGLAEARARVRGLLARLRDPCSGGPLHINIALAGGVTSVDFEPDWIPVADMLTAATAPALPVPAVPAVAREAFVPPFELGARGVVVAGLDCPLTPGQAQALAEGLGYPLIADAGSGLRGLQSSVLVTQADVFLAISPPPPPDCVIRLGLPPMSLSVQRWLARARVPTLRISDARLPPGDFLTRSSPLASMRTDGIALLLSRAAGAPLGDPDWVAAWAQREVACLGRVATTRDAMGWGEVRAAGRICEAPGYNFLMAANSMAGRYANMFARGARRVMINRGVNGIDGTVSTFLGAIVGGGGRGMLLIGDQAMQHDVGGLEAARTPGLAGAICVLNNAGSSLLSLFGLDALPEHERLFRNPPSMRLEGAAAAFGLAYRRCADETSLLAALEEGVTAPGLLLIEVVVPRTLDADLAALLAAGAAPD